MSSVHLDCSGLPNRIQLTADQTVPTTIYVDGQDFINRLDQTLSQQIYELQDKQLSFKERLILALASNPYLLYHSKEDKSVQFHLNAVLICKQADAIIEELENPQRSK